MIAWLIRACIANRVLVLMLAAALAGMGIYSARSIAVDAIPDLSDVQVIIRTEFMGQAPEVIEDQVTYPLATAMLAVPHAKVVRGFSMFNDSFVYIIFDDGTDPYWARSRVLEQISTVADRMPAGVVPQLGPDATGVGWVYQYVLATGPYSPDHPQGLWHDRLTDTWYANPADAGPQAQLTHERIFSQSTVRFVDPISGSSYANPEQAPAPVRDGLKMLSSQRALSTDPITGTPLVQPDVSLSELRSMQDWLLRYELVALEGVSEVAAVGGFEKQYQIQVDPVRLQAYGIGLEQIAMAVRAANADTGGSVLERGETQLVVRGRGYLGSLDAKTLRSARNTDWLAVERAYTQQVLSDLRSTAVSRGEDGIPITVGQLAEVTALGVGRTGLAEWNGQGETVGGIVVMRQGENARETIERVRTRLSELESVLPPGVAVLTAYDRSDLIDRAIATLTETLIEEILTVSAVVWLFLLHARSSLVAVCVLPLGALCSISLMHLLGINANIMSLGGIAVAIGVMVDSSIVMVENLHKEMEAEQAAQREGRATRPWLTLVGDAACAVGPALFNSLLIITISFLPIFLLTGQSGRLFAPLAWTKTFAMGVAALLSVTIIPVFMTLFVGERVLPSTWSQRTQNLVFWLSVLVPALLFALLPLPTLEPYRWHVVIIYLVLAIILLRRQAVQPEDRHPLSRFLQALYDRGFQISLGHPWKVLLGALLCVSISVLPLSRLGEEFMPPLEEGDFLYMPNADPGLSITKARELLQQTDALIAQFPEVVSVMGKVGRANTATDPAPLTMIETTIQLQRDRSKWRHVPETRWFGLVHGTRPITLEELTDGYQLPGGQRVPGINDVLRVPGLPGALTRGAMPIRTRIDMLATGIRTPVGIKLMGDDLPQLADLADRVIAVLQSDVRTAARTKSATTERVTGATYVDIVPDRLALARYGLDVATVQEAVMGALGGTPITTTVEGRSRYTVSVRLSPELRDDLGDLGRLLLRAPSMEGQEAVLIPLSQVAQVVERNGPPMIRSENARLSAWIWVTPADTNVVGYVEAARAAVSEQVSLPQGVSLVWSGSFEYIEEAKSSLMIAVPLVLLAILCILYLHLRSWLYTSIVVGALSFSVIGAIWAVFLCEYQISVAVYVGVIALLGLDTETSLVMLHYQDESIRKAKESGRLRHWGELWEAIHAGAVQRIRPKTMTVLTTFIGLVPLMWAEGAGADTMRRLAAPMLGGLITSTIMELLVFPAVYYLLMRRKLPRSLA